LKPSLREVLAETHVADVAIAWLVLQALESAFWFVLPPIVRAVGFVFMAIAIMGVPYHSNGLDFMDRMQLLEMSLRLVSALAAAASAWVLSRWIYGAGPIRSLSMSWKRVRRISHV